jgi:hypothetical protein
MKYRNILFLALLMFLFACSGEAYIKVTNETPETIMVSVNHRADEVLPPGDTTDTYTISVNRGVLNQIPVSATGEWLSDYNESVAVANGDVVVHRVNPQMADISFVNTSVDSAILRYENTLYHYLDGGDSVRAKHVADGNVDLDYEGRYIFTQHVEKFWFPGNRYRFELVPDACEIQLNNLHDNRAIYYVYISPSDADTWGEDQLGDNTILYPNEAYVWKAEAGKAYDMRVEAGDPHPDSALYVYDFFDEDLCDADITWIYEFPEIFTPVTLSKSTKMTASGLLMRKPQALNKEILREEKALRIEKLGKKPVEAKAAVKQLKK